MRTFNPGILPALLLLLLILRPAMMLALPALLLALPALLPPKLLLAPVATLRIVHIDRTYTTWVRMATLEGIAAVVELYIF